MPGSPPSTVTEPGTNPPCNTRSSSPIRVGAGAHAAVSTSAMGRGTAATGPTASAAGAATTTSSTSEFHASQPPQRPVHLGSAAPHSLHR